MSDTTTQQGAEPSSRFGSRPQVIVDGTPLADDLVPALVAVSVEGHLHLPDVFVLTFQDTHGDVASRAKIRFGSQVEIRATRDGDGTMTPLIKGEVNALEQEADTAGTRTVVRGYDVSYRLCRGRRTRTFADTTDADIVRRVAADAGIELGEVVDDGPCYPHVSQMNLTDWEFLRARAHETGHELAIQGDRLTWHTPRPSSDAPGVGTDLNIAPQPLQLLLGGNLRRFRPRVSAAAQVGQVQVRGWDPVAKAAVTGTADAATASAAVGVGPSELAGAFDPPAHVVVDRAVTSQAEADALAAAVAEQIACSHAEAEGTALGDPALLPGAAVSVGCVGWPHDGSYVLTSARHTYDRTGYHTSFTVSGRQERSLLGLASMGATKGSHRGSGPQIHGVVVGQVTDIADPDHQFRVKVSFPWLSDDYESWWARVAVPGAGDGRGLAWLPEVDDEVLVAFGHADGRTPYVIGGLYNGVDRAPDAEQLVDESAGQVVQRSLVSRKGHRLVLGDDDSAPKVELATGDGNLTITLDASQTTITIDSQGSVTISGSTGVKISSDSDIDIEASGSLKLSAQTGVTIDGGPSVSVSGDLIRLN